MSDAGMAPDPTYWGYQRRLAREYVIPLIEDTVGPIRDRTVLDLGCGEGGLAFEASLAGARATGLDLDADRVMRGRTLAGMSDVDLDLRVVDVNALPAAAADVVVVRDVIEHLERPGEFLAGLGRHLEPGGVVYISFPPYFSPFGLHQQLLPGRVVRHLPWLSLLPAALIRNHLAKGPHAQDLRELTECRLTIASFERAAARAGFERLRRTAYLVRPAHAVRFGWPVVPAGPLAAMPGVRELFVSGLSYLLRPVSATR